MSTFSGLVYKKKKKFPLSKIPFTTASRAVDGIRKRDVGQSTHLKCLDLSSPVKYRAFGEEFQNLHPKIYLSKAHTQVFIKFREVFLNKANLEIILPSLKSNTY